MKNNNLKYHHIGVPTKEIREGEYYLPELGMYVLDYQKNQYGIEWIRFDENCKFPDIVKEVPHIAFEVDDVYKAIEGKKVIIAPNSPSEEAVVAFIEEDGFLVELLQVTKRE